MLAALAALMVGSPFIVIVIVTAWMYFKPVKHRPTKHKF